MTGSASARSGSALRDRLLVLNRNKWLIAIVVVVVPIVAVFVSNLQPHVYRASSDVLLSNENLAAGLLGLPDTSSSQAPDRFAQTQADLASVPTVVQQALTAARVRESVGSFLGSGSVAPQPNSDLLRFSVDDQDGAVAVRLATAWAHSFTAYRHRLDTAAVDTAIVDVQTQMEKLAKSGDTKSGLYSSLANKQQQLKTLATLSTSRAQVVRDASSATQVEPRPLRNGALGLVLAIVLGIGLAFTKEALNTRARTASEVAEELDFPLLGRIPRPPSKIARSNSLVMMSHPHGPDAEPFRMLRINFEFALELLESGKGAPAVMVTSGTLAEGKTTTIGNLAVALALAGKNVILLDFDFRRPRVDKVFNLNGRPTVRDVARGRVPVERALTQVMLPGQTTRASGVAPPGRLAVLPAGEASPSLGEFIGSPVADEILARLRKHGDVILIDAPPLLHVGDAVALCAKVDGVFVVSRLNVVRRSMLHEVNRVLATTPSTRLGYVLTDSDRDASYAYEAYYG